MNFIVDIIKALGTIGNIEGQRKLTPSENLQKKLYLACLEGPNRVLGVCLRIAELITNGLYNSTFTEMNEFNLEDYYQTHGYLTNNVSLTGFPLSPPDVIFTDPKTQAYCVQSLYRDLLVPEPRPVHKYPQNNIWELLKFRLEADTNFCTVEFPKYFKPSDIAMRIGGLLTGNPKLSGNLANPAYNIFTTIFNTFVELTQTFSNMSLQVAGTEILATIFQNKSTHNVSSEIIKRNLQNISRTHLFLATEPVRLAWADMLDDVSTQEKLWAVARTSFCEIRLIMDFLRKKTTTSYTRVFFENDLSFDLIPANDLRTIDFLLAVTGNATQAISWFSPCSFEIPIFDEDLEKTFVGDQMVEGACQPLAMHLTSFRDSSLFQLSINKRNLTPDNQIEKFFTYKPENKAPLLSLTDPAKTAINTAGNMNFMLSCKQANLLLDMEGKLSINLGKIDRPKARATFEYRVPIFISSILEKNFEEDIAKLFIQNHTTAALPTNTYQLLLQSVNMDPIMYLNFYDSCERLSPLSPFFRPTNELDYTIGFGYDIADIHSIIFQRCTLQNAIGLLNTFNVTFAIKYMGIPALLDKCQRLALDSGRSQFHDLLAEYMPDHYHQMEHEVEDRIGPPSMVPLMILTLLVSLSFFAIFTRCLRKKSHSRTVDQPTRHNNAAQSSGSPDTTNIAIGVKRENIDYSIAGGQPRRLFTPKKDLKKPVTKPTSSERAPLLDHALIDRTIYKHM